MNDITSFKTTFVRFSSQFSYRCWDSETTELLCRLPRTTVHMIHLITQEDLRRQRVFRDRFNPFDSMEEKEFISRYRFDKHSFGNLCSVVEEAKHPTGRSCSLSVSLQLCIALRFYWQGGYLSIIADIHHVSKTAASTALDCITTYLINWLIMLSIQITQQFNMHFMNMVVS